MMSYMRPSIEWDIDKILENIREADRRECDLWGISPKTALTCGFNGSVQPMTIIRKDRPVAMLGVVLSTGEEDHVIWMLGAEGLSAASIDIVRQGKLWIAHLAAPFGPKPVGNWVDTRNRTHTRFLQWAGFTRTQTIDYKGVEIAYYRRDPD